MSDTESEKDKELLDKLAEDFHQLVTNPDQLKPAVENFFNNLIDELTLGIIFEMHRKYKTGAGDIDETEQPPTDLPDIDTKKIQSVCPNCKRSVAAQKFASHLAGCMGLGRSRTSRGSTRTNTASASTSTSVPSTSSKKIENSPFSSPESDDDNDWGSRKKKPKTQKKKLIKKSGKTQEQIDDSDKTLKKGKKKKAAKAPSKIENLVTEGITDEERAFIDKLFEDTFSSN